MLLADSITSMKNSLIFFLVDIQLQINKIVENLQHLVTQACKLHEEENSGETQVKTYDG